MFQMRNAICVPIAGLQPTSESTLVPYIFLPDSDLFTCVTATTIIHNSLMTVT